MGHVVLALSATHLLVWSLLERQNWGQKKLGLWQYTKRLSVSTILYAIIFVGYVYSLYGYQIDCGGMAWIGMAVILPRLIAGLACGHYSGRSWQNLVGCQFVGIAAVSGAGAALCGRGLTETARSVGITLSGLLTSPTVWSVLAAYSLSLGFGTVLLRFIAAALSGPKNGSDPGGDKLGNTIGLLERTLITSLVIFWPTLDATAIGLIFSAKSIARFPELEQKRQTHFSEYYLIGSLASFMIAIASGLIARSFVHP